LEEKYGITCDVFDLRSLVPLNYEPLIESIKKTGKMVLASDACERGNFLHTISSNLQNLAFDYLDAPITVVGSKNWITPAAEQEASFFPQVEWMLDAIHTRIMPLNGHEVTTKWTDGEFLRTNKLGV
jgi:2-oxoisovalerate dehydrogenase E1 component